MSRNLPPQLDHVLTELDPADALRESIRHRLKLGPDEEIECPRAKSSMTPCVGRDGSSAVCEILGEPACVGCEWTVDELRRVERARCDR